MFLIHPAIQAVSVSLMFYAFYLGTKRFTSLHLKRIVPFKRKRHVIFGKSCILLLTAGGAGGFITAYLLWGMTMVSGTHAEIALILAIPVTIVFSTGLYLNRNGKNNKSLIAIHGIAGLITLILAVFQAVTGAEILAALLNSL